MSVDDLSPADREAAVKHIDGFLEQYDREMARLPDTTGTGPTGQARLEMEARFRRHLSRLRQHARSVDRPDLADQLGQFTYQLRSPCVELRELLASG